MEANDLVVPRANKPKLQKKSTTENNTQLPGTWALEYERDEIKRQKKFRLSLKALLSLLVFAFLAALFFGVDGIRELIKMLWQNG